MPMWRLWNIAKYFIIVELYYSCFVKSSILCCIQSMRQWCDKFQHHWWTASIQQWLLFTSCRLYLLSNFAFSQVNIQRDASFSRIYPCVILKWLRKRTILLKIKFDRIFQTMSWTTKSKIKRYTKLAVPRAWVAVVTRANMIPAYTVVHHLAVGVGDARVTKSWTWKQFLNVKWQIQCKHIIISCEHLNVHTY